MLRKCDAMLSKATAIIKENTHKHVIKVPRNIKKIEAADRVNGNTFD